METLIKAFSLGPIDLTLRHYTRNKYDTRQDNVFSIDSKLVRADKSEVLYFINSFLNRNSLFLNLNPENYIAMGQKVERMITQAPLFESNQAINDWLIKNWRSFD